VGKGSQCVRLTTHHIHVPNVMKSGSLNLLEPSGPHRDCYGTAVPLQWKTKNSAPNLSQVTLASIRDCFVPDPFQFISDILQFRLIGLYFGLMKELLNEP